MCAVWRAHGFEQTQIVGKIGQAPGDYMNHLTLLLQMSCHRDIAGADHFGALALQKLRPDDDIGRACLIFDGHEDDAFRRAWPLTEEDDPRNSDGSAIAIGHSRQRDAGQRTDRLKPLAQECDRMAFQGQ